MQVVLGLSFGGKSIDLRVKYQYPILTPYVDVKDLVSGYSLMIKRIKDFPINFIFYGTFVAMRTSFNKT